MCFIQPWVWFQTGYLLPVAMIVLLDCKNHVYYKKADARVRQKHVRKEVKRYDAFNYVAFCETMADCITASWSKCTYLLNVSSVIAAFIMQLPPPR